MLYLGQGAFLRCHLTFILLISSDLLAVVSCFKPVAVRLCPNVPLPYPRLHLLLRRGRGLLLLVLSLIMTNFFRSIQPIIHRGFQALQDV